MPTYLSPGVYLEEWSGDQSTDGPRPGAGTGRPDRPIRVTRSRWLPATTTAATLGIAEYGPVNEPVLVTAMSQFEEIFGSPVFDTYLARAVAGFFGNGGRRCYVVRVNGVRSPDVSPAAWAEAVLDGDDGGPVALVRSRLPGRYGNQLAVSVRFETTSADGFDLLVRENDELVEVLDGMRVSEGHRFAPDYAAAVSRCVDLTVYRPMFPARGAVTRLRGGADGRAESDGAARPVFVSHGEGLKALEPIDDIDVVCAPDLLSAYRQGLADMPTVLTAQWELIAHCESMGGRIALLDSPPGLSPQQARDWRSDIARYDTASAVLYYPWLRSSNPSTGMVETVPPSGLLAGVWARSAAERGIGRTVANDAIRGAVGCETAVSRNELDLLNPVGVNVLADVAGEGPTVIGGRTLSSDPAQRFIGPRRLTTFVRRNVTTSLRWVLYEANGPHLWAQVADELAGFCDLLLRGGALAGDTPEDAYRVTCDASNNTLERRELGQVVADLQLWPVDGPALSMRLVFASA